MNRLPSERYPSASLDRQKMSARCALIGSATASNTASHATRAAGFHLRSRSCSTLSSRARSTIRAVRPNKMRPLTVASQLGWRCQKARSVAKVSSLTRIHVNSVESRLATAARPAVSLSLLRASQPTSTAARTGRPTSGTTMPTSLASGADTAGRTLRPPVGKSRPGTGATRQHRRRGWRRGRPFAGRCGRWTPIFAAVLTKSITSLWSLCLCYRSPGPRQRRVSGSLKRRGLRTRCRGRT